MELFRHESHRVNGLKPGHYAKSLDPRRDRCGWCIVCCPVCEKLLTVGVNHVVSDNGTVSPSLVCPHPPCTFHTFVKLNDWQEEQAAQG